jgi:hypothetical protein
MARKRIRLSQFEIEGETFEEGADLVHHYKRCNWRISAVGHTPVELVWESRDHARECNGEPRRLGRRPDPQGESLIPQAFVKAMSLELLAGRRRPVDRFSVTR